MADRREIRADEALEREQREDRRDEMTPAPRFPAGSRDERVLTGILSARSMLIGLESQAALRALDDAVRALGEPVPNVAACAICGDEEPFHVHDGDRRIEDYFTVGRGQTDFEAAVAWKRRALEAERG